MKLHWSPRSPFVRKVMITLHETGLVDDVELVRSVVAVHLLPNPAVLRDNPLGKIPTLITDDDMALFDSRVICEYLDDKSDANLVPAQGNARFEQLRWQAVGDGLMDILLLWRTELTRPDGAWEAVTDGWRQKIRAAMVQLEAEAGFLAAAPFGVGQISLICALGQLDFRWADSAWRSHFPQLSALERDWADRPSVRATIVVNDDGDAGPEPTLGHLHFRD